MTLKKYAKLINDLAKKYPNAKVVYSGDDEGNFFGEVAFAPTVGKYDADEGMFDSNSEKVNAVCVN